MDFVRNAVGSGENQGQNNDNEQGQSDEQRQQQQGSSGSGGGILGSMSDKLNSIAGGGKDSEKNEDYLDKGESFKPQDDLAS